MFAVVVLGLWSVFLVPGVFAADATKTTSDLFDFATLLRTFSELFSWFWIVIASIVGKLMTNSLIYGEALHLDVFLWKLWQITRNIANFGLGFFFLYELLKYVIQPRENKSPMSIIKELLMAGVGIQLSWFAIMVLVDVSTVLFSLVSSFPSQVIASEPVSSQALNTVIEASCPDKGTNTTAQPQGNVLCKGQKEVVKFFTDGGGSQHKKSTDAWIITVETREWEGLTKEQLFDYLLPSQDSLSWPLMFFGFEVFKTAQLSDYSHVNGVSQVEIEFKAMIQIFLHFGMMLMYTLSLIVLMVVLIARGLYLWVFIVLSPIVVLLTFLMPKAVSSKEVFWDIKKMIKLIFQPVRYAMYISLMMIMLVILNWVFKFNTVNTDSPIVINDQGMSAGDGLISVIMEQWSIGIYDLILGGITLFVMWQLVQMAITEKTGISWVDNLTDSISKTTKGFVDTAPIIPVPWKNTTVGVGSLLDSDIIWEKIQEKQNEFTRLQGEQRNAVSKIFGFWDDGEIQQADLKELSQILSSKGDPKGKIADYISKLKKIKETSKFYFTDLEWDFVSLFTDKKYQTILQREYGFTNLDTVTDKDKFYTYLNSSHGSNWEKIYKIFFDAENAPTSYENLVGSDKESYAIKSKKTS